MTISIEFGLTIIIQLLAVGIMIGVYKATIGFMQEQINDIKSEISGHNDLLNKFMERLIVAENEIKNINHILSLIEMEHK